MLSSDSCDGAHPTRASLENKRLLLAPVGTSFEPTGLADKQSGGL